MYEKVFYGAVLLVSRIVIVPVFGQLNFGSQTLHRSFDDFKQLNRAPLYDFTTKYDVKLSGRDAQIGRQIDLFTWFPFYGSKYNYTVISIHGYIAFANVEEQGLNFVVGDVPEWPEKSDPAMIAVYMCRQKPSDLDPKHSGVRYRLLTRPDVQLGSNGVNKAHNSGSNPFQARDYLDSSQAASDTIDMMHRDLMDGMVGSHSFRPDLVLLVTWENMTYYQASSEDENLKTSTYQMALMTDRAGQMSYLILNYHSLKYAGGDISGNMKRGRCTSLINGGNRTGSLAVDPYFSKYPPTLAQVSSVPHKVAGRYLFRVDDIARKGGCSNLTSGTYRLTLYPDIVNMLGDTVVQVNGPCFDVNKPAPVLNIGEHKAATCLVKNAAIAECKMRQFYQWGAKDVFLAYDSMKAYVGTIYYVPVGLDPFGLIVDNLADWFRNPPPTALYIRWYPGNFTGPNNLLIPNLELSVYGYKEVDDEYSQKYVNTLKKLVVLNPNLDNSHAYGQESSSNLTKRYNIMATIGRLRDRAVDADLYTYSFGVLKLSISDKVSLSQAEQGIWSPPIPLHWLWLLLDSDAQNLMSDPERKQNFVSAIASKSCINWFEEDGRQWNFIQETETNASCPCTLKQAESDMGRFMPHPRCSQKFRNVGCDTFTGAKECFLSAENIISKFATHYGQVCCYDADGYLMQTTYASVQPDIVKGAERDSLPYNPGFPQRAYEFGTPMFHKQYEAPTLSNYFHDVMPYYHCCKWSVNHCQFFYWRRPSSGCQDYRPPGIASVIGAGHFTTFDGLQYTFHGNGTYVYLRKIGDQRGPFVMVQLRMEQFPNRFIDFSHRDTIQEFLVQPTNASVVTGIAIQEGITDEVDRIIIVCRKDTRRFKYRTSILVNDEIRYFDAMKLQKFKGVTIYINDVKEGQSEIYVTLLKSRIGIRIRESYATVISQQQILEESMGLLDVKLSIPSDYFYLRNPNERQNGNYRFIPHGMVGTFSNETNDEFIDPETYIPLGTSVKLDYETSRILQRWNIDKLGITNLFTLQNPEHSEWPEAYLLEPIYKVSPSFLQRVPFEPIYDTVFESWWQNCGLNSHLIYEYQGVRCPPRSISEQLHQTCRGDLWCVYDYAFLQQRELAMNIYTEKSIDMKARAAAKVPLRSCAAINIQYPEYLYIEPARGGYLEGDKVQFHCYQNGWLKGDADYVCSGGEWTKGDQPWCRDRDLEDTLRYLAIIFGILLGVAFIATIFLCCFCIGKQRQRNHQQENRPTPRIPPRPTALYRLEESEKNPKNLAAPPPAYPDKLSDDEFYPEEDKVRILSPANKRDNGQRPMLAFTSV